MKVYPNYIVKNKVVEQENLHYHYNPRCDDFEVNVGGVGCYLDLLKEDGKIPKGLMVTRANNILRDNEENAKKFGQEFADLFGKLKEKNADVKLYSQGAFYATSGLNMMSDESIKKINLIEFYSPCTSRNLGISKIESPQKFVDKCKKNNHFPKINIRVVQGDIITGPREGIEILKMLFECDYPAEKINFYHHKPTNEINRHMDFKGFYERVYVKENTKTTTVAITKEAYKEDYETNKITEEVIDIFNEKIKQEQSFARILGNKGKKGMQVTTKETKQKKVIKLKYPRAPIFKKPQEQNPQEQKFINKITSTCNNPNQNNSRVTHIRELSESNFGNNKKPKKENLNDPTTNHLNPIRSKIGGKSQINRQQLSSFLNY